MSKAQHESIFALRLRSLLSQDGETITSLARKLGVSRQAVSQYTYGKTQPNADKLIIIAEHFGVSVDYLLGFSDCKKYPTYSTYDEANLRLRRVSEKTKCAFAALDVAKAEFEELNRYLDIFGAGARRGIGNDGKGNEKA